MERKDETYSLMAYAAGFLQETQRRGQRRCPSKYGILTAKFHLLGAPLKPLRLWSAYRPCKACSPLCPKANPPLGPRQGRTIAEQSSASQPASLLTGRTLTGAVPRIVLSPRGDTHKKPLDSGFSYPGNGRACGKRQHPSTLLAESHGTA